MTDTATKISSEWLDAQLAAARREGSGPQDVLSRWLKRVEAAWGDLDARQRVFHKRPDTDPQKRAVLRVMRIHHRLFDFRQRESARTWARNNAPQCQAQRKREGQKMVWDRDFRHLSSSLHHFAAVRGVPVDTAQDVVLAVAERVHREVVRLYTSRLGEIQYGIDGECVVYDPKGQQERTVRHGGVRVNRVFRPAPGADRVVEFAFYRASGKSRGQRCYTATLPIDFDTESVELPKPKEPPQTYEAAPGSDNLVTFLSRYSHRVDGDSKNLWLKAHLGLIVARYCLEEGIRAIPGLRRDLDPGFDDSPAYGGSQVDRWCTKKCQWVVKPGVSLADIDLLQRTLTVQIASGSGCRRIKMPITRLVSDFPKTESVGDGFVRIAGAAGQVRRYAAVGRHSDGEVDITCNESLSAARVAFGLPATPDAALIGNDPWEGCLQESVLAQPDRPRRTPPLRQASSGRGFAAASAALSSGFFD